MGILPVATVNSGMFCVSMNCIFVVSVMCIVSGIADIHLMFSWPEIQTDCILTCFNHTGLHAFPKM